MNVRGHSFFQPRAQLPGQLQLADLYQSEGKADLAKQQLADLKDKDPKGAAGMTAAEKLNPTSGPALPQQ